MGRIWPSAAAIRMLAEVALRLMIAAKGPVCTACGQASKRHGAGYKLRVGAPRLK